MPAEKRDEEQGLEKARIVSLLQSTPFACDALRWIVPGMSADELALITA